MKKAGLILLGILSINVFAFSTEMKIENACRRIAKDLIWEKSHELGSFFFYDDLKAELCGHDFNWAKSTTYVKFCAQGNDGRKYEVTVKKPVIGECKE